MQKLNIYLDKYEIKNIMMTRIFIGQRFWKPNANIAVGDLIPVYLINENNQKVLQLMRWGYSKFNNDKLTAFARFETLKNKWKYSGFGVVPMKGFFFKQKEAKMVNDFHVHEKENDILFAAAIYFEMKIFNSTKYKVMILSKSTDNNENLFCYLYRMPLFLCKRSIITWLKTQKLERHDTICLSKPKEIGKWIHCKDNKDEYDILRTAEEWKLEMEAKEIDWEKAFENY